MKALVLGASGLVGSKLLAGLRQVGGFEVYGTYCHRPRAGLLAADIAHGEQVSALFRALRPDIVVLTAALTNVDYCEEHPDEARAINLGGTQAVQAACGERGAKLVFLSTDYVFDGENGPYDEQSVPHPINYYGRTKLWGEEVVRQLPNHLIIRSTVVYDWDPDSKNFLMQLVNRLRVRQPLQVPCDQIGTPTLAGNLAATIARLVVHGRSGTYHVAGTDRLSRFEFAHRAAKVLGLDPSCLIPVETAQLQQKARRPLKAGLIVAKASAEPGVRLLSTSEGLAMVLKQYQQSLEGN